MDDLANVGSNPTGEGASAPVTETSAPAPAPSAREAIQRAFESVSGEKPQPPAGDRSRDEAGRFAPKAADAPAKAAPEAVEGQQAPAQPEAPANVPPPPQRFAKPAQEAWAQAPEAVRAEVARMEAELTKGLSEYQQRWEPIKQFDEMARQGGTTLQAALTAYTNMETLIRQDPVRGLYEVCRNAGIDPAQVGAALAGIQGQGGASPEVAGLKEHIRRLEEQISGVGKSITERETLAQVEAFAKDHPRFDELSGTIAEMIQTGFAKDLADAYAKADRLNPAPAQAPAEAAPAAPKGPDLAQTQKKAALSITGSPASGSNPSSRKPAGSTREALARAFAETGLN